MAPRTSSGGLPIRTQASLPPILEGVRRVRGALQDSVLGTNGIKEGQRGSDLTLWVGTYVPSQHWGGGLLT